MVPPRVDWFRHFSIAFCQWEWSNRSICCLFGMFVGQKPHSPSGPGNLEIHQTPTSINIFCYNLMNLKNIDVHSTLLPRKKKQHKSTSKAGKSMPIACQSAMARKLRGSWCFFVGKTQEVLLDFAGNVPWSLTWNMIMEVWKMMFLSKWVIRRFHLNLARECRNWTRNVCSCFGVFLFCCKHFGNYIVSYLGFWYESCWMNDKRENNVFGRTSCICETHHLSPSLLRLHEDPRKKERQPMQKQNT